MIALVDDLSWKEICDDFEMRDERMYLFTKVRVKYLWYNGDEDTEIDVYQSVWVNYELEWQERYKTEFVSFIKNKRLAELLDLPIRIKSYRATEDNVDVKEIDTILIPMYKGTENENNISEMDWLELYLRPRY